jgi:DNA-directed RNA polymerase specialized sigma24 family protein
VWRTVVNAAKKATRRPLVEVGQEDSRTDFVPEPVTEVAPLVASLPERQRLVIFLRYYADLDYRTIAATLDVEVGTVSASLAAAHVALRKKLEKVQRDA